MIEANLKDDIFLIMPRRFGDQRGFSLKPIAAKNI